MPTTIVYPSIDVSATASISMVVGTAASLAGSLTASTLTVTGTSTFSGTSVFVGTAQFLATATFSATTAFLTSVSISGTLSVGTLVVSGTASFSATVAFTNASVTTLGVTGSASFAGQATFAATVTFSATVNVLTAMRVSGTASVGTFKIAGFPAGSVQLGSVSLSAGGNLAVRFSGSWSDYAVLELYTFFKSTPSGSVNLDLFTDGGTTAFLTVGGVGSATVSHMFIDAHIFNGTAFKGAVLRRTTNAVVAANATATANTGFINCIGVRVGTSLSISSGQALLYGRRR